MIVTEQKLQVFADKFGLEVSTVKCLSLLCENEKELELECETIGTEDLEDLDEEEDIYFEGDEFEEEIPDEI
jgi:hypothetical protein